MKLGDMSRKQAKRIVDKEQMAKDRVLRKDGTILRTPKPINYHYDYKPKTQEEFEQLGDEVLAFAQLPTTTNINRFCFDKKISPYRFKRFDNAYFQEMLELAKYIIADRNRTAVNDKVFDKDIYIKELRELDRDYKEDCDDQIAKRVAGTKEALGSITMVDWMTYDENKDGDGKSLQQMPKK
jgi:hypothetical protein